MISIYNLKPAFQKLLRPFSNTLARKDFTPNQITILAFIISALVGILLVVYSYNIKVFFLIPAALILRMILNALDGMLAREHQMESALGTFLNELGDVFSDSFLYLPFCLVPGVWPFLVIVMVLLAVISEMTGIIAVQTGGRRRYDGPMGKSDRAFILGLIAFLFALGLKAGIWTHILFGIIILLLMVTIINRVKKSLQEVKSAQS